MYEKLAKLYFDRMREAAKDWTYAVAPKQLDTSQPVRKIESALDIQAHILWMLLRISNIDREKAARWIGFIQGYLWMNGYYTIDELRQHVSMARRDEEELDAYRNA